MANPPRSPERPELANARQAHERELYRVRYELQTKLQDTEVELAKVREASTRSMRSAQALGEGCVVLLGIVSRYQRAVRSLGHSLAEDEVALVEAIRKLAENP